MLSRLLYYTFLKPLSLLPMGLLFGLSDGLYLLMYYVVRYRRRVVWQNLRNSFPTYTDAELTRISRSFYHHLCDLAVESLKIFSISLEEAVGRNTIQNPEVADRLFEEGRSIILTTGHYNNWELFILTANAQLKHPIVGVFQPIRNAFFNQKMNATRGRFGMLLVSKREIKEFNAGHQDLISATILAGDQAPGPSTKKVYHTMFLNQPTDVVFGTEKFASQYNRPVVFVAISKVSRGRYMSRLELIEEFPSQAVSGSITEKITRRLEEQILEQPEYWLWSHKRWKKRKVERVGPAHSENNSIR